MRKILRRVFAAEIELVAGLFAPSGRRPPKKISRLESGTSPAVPRRSAMEFRARSRVVERKRPARAEGPWQEFLGGMLVLGRFLKGAALSSTFVSILIHGGLLVFLWGMTASEVKVEEPGVIQITIRRATSPRELTPATSPGPEDLSIPGPELDPEPPVDIPDLSTAQTAPEPPPLEKPEKETPRDSRNDTTAESVGAPGTGEVAQLFPEGRPGPPAILGVGSSPPPGDSDGRGGDGEGDGVGSRSRGRAAALFRYGGNLKTEDAVARGLRWLAAHQDPDGGWSAADFGRHCHHFTQCPGRGLQEFDTGVTALCALAFLGAGQIPGSGTVYSKTLESALENIIKSQRSDGALGARGQKFLYNHAIATLAICEAYATTRDGGYLKPALAAMNFSADCQQPGGGWDYTGAVTGRNDLSITGWQVMAFRAAEVAGFPAPETTRRRLREFLSRASTPGGRAIYANKGVGQGRRGVNMTAVALLSRLYTGTGLNSPWVASAADRLIRQPPEPDLVYDWDNHYQSSYYWYYATLALFHLGGERWEAWNHFLKKKILPDQSLEVHEIGSWPPDPNWLGAMGGRVFTTAMNVMTLEIYYRYPPLHSYGR